MVSVSLLLTSMVLKAASTFGNLLMSSAAKSFSISEPSFCGFGFAVPCISARCGEPSSVEPPKELRLSWACGVLGPKLSVRESRVAASCLFGSSVEPSLVVVDPCGERAPRVSDARRLVKSIGVSATAMCGFENSSNEMSSLWSSSISWKICIMRLLKMSLTSTMRRHFSKSGPLYIWKAFVKPSLHSTGESWRSWKKSSCLKATIKEPYREVSTSLTMSSVMLMGSSRSLLCSPAMRLSRLSR
mmetsp:Transcript_41617/g.107679  ORF Transcript_41617/g.107679 Transcript_41617/m.107679 type:complete len:244 (+) Transcript_41617:956-1687(+)